MSSNGTQEVVEDYLNSLDHISEDSELQREFINSATITEHEFENCPVRQDVKLNRRSVVSTDIFSVPEYEAQVDTAVEVSDRYNSLYIPSPPQDRDIDLIQKNDAKRKTCQDCGGRKRLPCGCGDGLETCSRCNGDALVNCSNCGGDGFNDCNTCGGKGYKKCSECNSWGSTSDPENCSTCPGSGQVPCPNRKCNQGSVKCERCSGGSVSCPACETGTVTCSTCGGSREVNCSTCEAVGELVKCKQGTLKFELITENTQVATKKGMPVKKISQANAHKISADMTETGESTEGVIQTGTRQWRVPAHRFSYRLDGEEYTVYKIGGEFDDNGEHPDLIYKNVRKSIKRRSILGLVAGGLLSLPLALSFDYASWAFVGLFTVFAGQFSTITEDVSQLDFRDRDLEGIIHLYAGIGAIALYWVTFSLPTTGSFGTIIAGITGLAALLAQGMPIPALPRIFGFPKSIKYTSIFWAEALVAGVAGWFLSTILFPSTTVSGLALPVIWVATALGFAPPEEDQEE